MRKSDPTRRAEAFTLVELVLVMILLCVIFALAAPSLSRSMHGRNLTQEASRVLALTEYARDEAASRGVPMDVWIDDQSGEYGVRAKSGFDGSGARTKQYTLPTGMHFDSAAATSGSGNQDYAVEFAPDGTLDPASAPTVRLVDQSNSGISISQTNNSTEYEIVKDSQ